MQCIGLVGLHLLIYGNDRDNRPCMILPIHGYMARAAPNAVSRDQRRSESAFEIFRPGSRTFQVQEAIFFKSHLNSVFLNYYYLFY